MQLPDARDTEVEVLVLDEHEQPVPGASIVLSNGGEEWLSDSEVPANVVGITNAEGKAILPRVPRDGCLVAAVKVPLGASAFRAVSDRGTVELTLAACDAVVRGRVVDHLGHGVAGVHVVLEQSIGIDCWFSLHRPVPRPRAVSRRTVTGPDGWFLFRASRNWGTCLLWPRLGRLRMMPLMVTIGEHDELQFEVPGRALLRGVVVDCWGAPLGGCEVWAGEPDLQSPLDESTGSVVTADPRGCFELPLSKAGTYVVVPLGDAATPAGGAITTEVAENQPAWVELRTAEPASIAATMVGSRQRTTRIVARSEPDKGTTREITTSSDGKFVFCGLERGVTYDVVAYQGDDEVARGRQQAGDPAPMVLRSTRFGACVLSCRVGGDGMRGIVRNRAQITVLSFDKRLGRDAPVAAVEWTGELEVRFDDLPPLHAALALSVDGVEVARSDSFWLGSQPATACLEVAIEGDLDVRPAHADSDWCVWVRHADGSEILGRRVVWLDAGAAFRCALPAGEYVLWLGHAGDREYRRVPCTVLPGETRVVRMP